MEMNAANVKHKIFPGKPSFVEKKKKMDENSRFGELSTDEIQKLWKRLSQKQQKKPQSSG